MSDSFKSKIIAWNRRRKEEKRRRQIIKKGVQTLEKAVMLMDTSADEVLKQGKKNVGWRELADASGKAPEHVKAATKKNIKDVSKSPQMR
ncbi:MAG: hypothetical protein PHW62_00695 [Candidatus Ratteibacteria bacterium]|nr:hypothetical protein [Candidatus Ratteibacteria bacterium]